MKPADHRKLKAAFSIWAENVPNPDEPLMGAGAKMYSAREMAKEVQAGSKLGKTFLEALEYGVEKEGIDAVVARMTRKPRP